ncbi:MAG TPA: class I SAM-dependent methyltransferase [Thermoplasmatales archaeon]|nr:class I SAM-dependent methyltransferase [Thermoplasmatales archaeon]
MNEWDKIAASFAATRRQPWEECVEFIEGMHGMAVDIGCGNARHLILMTSRCKFVFGLDASLNMARIARERLREEGIKNADVVCGNACNMPFKDASFDFAIFIAALHNIRGRENRIKALKELRRILKPDGRALISVWAKWQDRWRWYFVKKFFLRNGEHGDIYIPWKRDGLNVQRFYHLYSMRELKRDVRLAGFHIEKAWSVRKVARRHADNHFIIVRKFRNP